MPSVVSRRIFLVYIKYVWWWVGRLGDWLGRKKIIVYSFVYCMLPPGLSDLKSVLCLCVGEWRRRVKSVSSKFLSLVQVSTKQLVSVLDVGCQEFLGENFVRYSCR